jgi:hypothetical protein
MTDLKKQIFDLTLGDAPALTDLTYNGQSPSGTPVLRKLTWQSIRNLFLATHSGELHYFKGLVSNPQAVYAQRAQIPMFRASQALTITRIHIENSVTGQEIAGDLKWADDLVIGSLANAAVIDICDTTSGVFTVTTGMDDPTIASGKYVYFQLDSSPNAAVKDFYIEVYYTFD